MTTRVHRCCRPPLIDLHAYVVRQANGGVTPLRTTVDLASGAVQLQSLGSRPSGSAWTVHLTGELCRASLLPPRTQVSAPPSVVCTCRQAFGFISSGGCYGAGMENTHMACAGGWMKASNTS